jgi:serine/threonine protein phosphatase PrpC
LNKENQDCKNEQIDLRLSESSVCTVCFDGTSIHCANAGDSRAIISTVVEDADGNLIVTVSLLSEDHKPDLLEERKRILRMGGRIDTFHDTLNNNEPIGPYRVWLKE